MPVLRSNGAGPNPGWPDGGNATLGKRNSLTSGVGILYRPPSVPDATGRRAGSPNPVGVTDEAYFSTKQQGAQAPSWVPSQDGGQVRSPDTEPSPGEGTQDPERIAGRAGGARLLPATRSGEMSTIDEKCRQARLGTIRHRRDFLKAARGRRFTAPTLMMQARCRGDGEPPDGIRLGLTCSRKVGGAVVRNRAKRRLRAVAQEVLPLHGKSGWDYVLVGRAGTTAYHPFFDLIGDLRAALARVHGDTAGRGPG